MNRRSLLASMGPALFAVVAGCSTSDSSGDESDDKADGEAGDSGLTLDDPADMTFTGTGGSLTDTFELESGLTLVEAIFPNDANNKYELIRPNGEGTWNQKQVIGAAFHATLAHSVSGGDYKLDITTNKEWKVGIRQPRPSESDAEQLPSEVTGTGEDVIGPYLFEGQYTTTLINEEGRFVHSYIWAPDGESFSLGSNVETNNETIVDYDGLGYISGEIGEKWLVKFDQ